MGAEVDEDAVFVVGDHPDVAFVDAEEAGVDTAEVIEAVGVVVDIIRISSTRHNAVIINVCGPR